MIPYFFNSLHFHATLLNIHIRQCDKNLLTTTAAVCWNLARQLATRARRSRPRSTRTSPADIVPDDFDGAITPVSRRRSVCSVYLTAASASIFTVSTHRGGGRQSELLVWSVIYIHRLFTSMKTVTYFSVPANRKHPLSQFFITVQILAL